MRQIRVAVVGNSEIENEGLCHVLRKHPDLVPCCHCVVFGQDMVAWQGLCDHPETDVTVMLLPPALLGRTIPQWQACHPDVPIVAIVKGSDHWRGVTSLLNAGVTAILSTLDPWSVASMVRLAHNHTGAVETTLVRQILGEIQEDGRSTSTHLAPLHEQIWALMADGRTNPQIATACGLSLAQTKHAVHRVLHYLGVASRTQAALAYARKGMEESLGFDADPTGLQRPPVSVPTSLDQTRRSVR